MTDPPPRPSPVGDVAISLAVRAEYATVVAYLHRLTGDFDVAEEAVQEALVSALTAWRRDGLPPNPCGWLTVTARRKAVDRLRREVRRQSAADALAAAEIVADPQSATRPPGDAPSGTAIDDRLPMLFGCCHPALAVEARLALTLRAVVGLTTSQVARAFLVPEATVAQRIVRAKRKIVANGIAMQVPTTALSSRLDDVLTVVYLAYTATYLERADHQPAPALGGAFDSGPAGKAAAEAVGGIGRMVADDAVWLAELLAASLPQEPEAWGLLALLTFQHSRARARTTRDGGLVRLPDQDRSLWDRDAIDRGERYLGRAATMRRPGRFQLQAAIAACHASAPTWQETDTLQVLTLYDLLLVHDPSPVVRLNRAVALAEYAGAAEALAEVEALSGQLSSYHLWHATRAELLRRLGDEPAARVADERALELAGTEVERELLRERLRTSATRADVAGPP